MLITIHGERPDFIGDDTEEYVGNVLAHIAIRGELPPTVHQSDVCPECQVKVTGIDTDAQDGHLAVVINGAVVVIVGCEGYWVIDPAAVGMPGRNWMSLADQVNII